MKNDYKIYNSSYIANNLDSIKTSLIELKEYFKDKDSTNFYPYYNIFSLTAGSIPFYNIYKELHQIIVTNVRYRPIWFQSWINIHNHDNVLDWHDHNWDYHGYICIQPQHTVTEFKNYTIENEIGLTYFGNCNNPHRVVNKSKYTQPRITIGFDVTCDPIMNTDCLGFIPIL